MTMTAVSKFNAPLLALADEHSVLCVSVVC
jgi:hypothetical protein